ncbi:MAG: hypothetical protein JW941_05170 [Candidatus Coatesbacteria bacterium]|nr:hypothetical protein [Candidatus Coatesbacteria bacterium]
MLVTYVSGRGIYIVVLAIGLTVLAWKRGWRWWALVPGGLSSYFSYLTIRHLISDEPPVSSDSYFLLFIAQLICIGALGIMAFRGRDYVGD